MGENSSILSEYRADLLRRTKKLFKNREFDKDSFVGMNLICRSDEQYAKLVEFMESNPKLDIDEYMCAAIDIYLGNPIGTESEKIEKEWQEEEEREKRENKYND